MLVLTRKRGESVFLYFKDEQGKLIPDLEIKVTVLGVEDGRVRLGFAAPDDVGIYREELLTSPTPKEAPLAAA